MTKRMIIVVNRSRASNQRVDRIDYIWINAREWEGKQFTDIMFRANETSRRLKWYTTPSTYREAAEVVEVKSLKKAVALLKEFTPNLDTKDLKSRIKYNRTAIRSMMKRLDLQEKVYESMVS